MDGVTLRIVSREGSALATIGLYDANGTKLLAVGFRNGDMTKEVDACTKLQTFAEANGITNVG